MGGWGIEGRGRGGGGGGTDCAITKTYLTMSTHACNTNQMDQGQCPGPFGWGGGGGATGCMTNVSVDERHQQYASNWGGRTPGSQTPGVPSTLGLDVQLDGVRKMPQNTAKSTIIGRTQAAHKILSIFPCANKTGENRPQDESTFTKNK